MPPERLVKFQPRLRLLGTNDSQGDFRAKVILATDRCTGSTAQQGKLTEMRQGIGNGTLEKPLGRRTLAPRYATVATVWRNNARFGSSIVIGRQPSPVGRQSRGRLSSKSPRTAVTTQNRCRALSESRPSSGLAEVSGQKGCIS